jgi:PAS domain S-box-containing protein
MANERAFRAPQAVLIRLGLLALYVVTAKIGLSLAFVHPSATAVWAPSGIALGALLILGYRVAVVIFFAAFLADVTTHGSVVSSVGIALGSTCEAALGAYLVNRFAHGRSVLDRLPDIFRFVLFAGILSPALGATIGVMSLTLEVYVPSNAHYSIWWTWWLGDGTGDLIVAPLFLLFSKNDVVLLADFRRRGIEGVLLVVSIVVTGFLVFGDLLPSEAKSYPLTYLCIPALAWAAFRFGRWELATAVVALESIAIAETLRGYGPFSRGTQNESLLLLQAFMAIVTVMMLSVATLIWERRRVQEALMAEAIPHQVWGCRSDGLLNYCNEQWLNFTGLRREDARREGWTARVHPADLERVRKAREEAARRHAPYEVELRLRGADGSYRRFLSRATGLYDDNGQVIQWFGTNTDVEERCRVDEALREAHAELAHVARLTTMGELVVSLAHELNQPLAGVITNGEACRRWLDHDPPNLGEAMNAVRRVMRDAARAGDVVARTRTFLQRLPSERVPVDVGHVIRESLAFVAADVARRGVVVREMLSEDLPPVLADRIQLQQVVLNLILNGLEAMEHMADQTRDLLIRAERGEVGGRPGVLITVQDTGAGVEEKNLERLFDTFYTTKPSGLGMGLSISRSIVEAHEGRLWGVPNTGRGMTFYFALPVLGSQSH